jgi:hypothetical protein
MHHHLCMQPFSQRCVWHGSLRVQQQALLHEQILLITGSWPRTMLPALADSSLVSLIHRVPGIAACGCWQQLPHLQAFTTTSAAAAADEEQKRPSRSSRRKTRSPDAYKARLPPGFGRYGSKLLETDPERFERMRVICGFYDNVPPSQRPRHVTISNLQTLNFLKDIDPYYKLSLLSYRSKLANQQLMGPLRSTQAYLNQLAVQQSAFTPIIPQFEAPGAPAAAAASSAGSSSSSSSSDTTTTTSSSSSSTGS